MLIQKKTHKIKLSSWLYAFFCPKFFKSLIIFNESSEKNVHISKKYLDFLTILTDFVIIYSSKKGGGSYEKESFEKNDRLFY